MGIYIYCGAMVQAWRSEESLCESFLAFFHVGDSVQPIGITVSKFLYLLDSDASPKIDF